MVNSLNNEATSSPQAVPADLVADAASRRSFLKQAGLGVVSAASLLMASPLINLQAQAEKPKLAGKMADKIDVNALIAAPQPIVAQDYSRLLAGLEGLSPNQIKQHLGLYQGYVKKANEIHTLMGAATPNPTTVNATYDPYRELLVESSFAMNGIILHELYFDNLGGVAGDKAPSQALQNTFAKAFGSWDGFITQLKSAGKAMRGWAVVAFNLRDNRIHMYGLDTHNQWAPLHTIPLLVLDVYEHAYMIDFGTNRGAYLDAFLSNINWSVVESRLNSLPLHIKRS
jgi:superoxide dismutase, Fe-Mn family